uniref:Iron-binding zinc finger CDGSH type domain-containing protein n=1 Tax=Chromera velia CCMP2878 TaxID=1169474 RepID=A0A0G4FDE8_9ALVE|mmetsp:Transcript_17602/g.35724  ORF Transcript_17602/g.35724 Transcript_17602/m.35724 type:complete len:226 (-) Transcript_17602:205-882(-)|eukprot:Cvel_16302.t1-p1 / transcript=Cvel_16302.t1 / gene=Cvel_16302 / organism=Chromera_velia_CCMP2878 / gene_product=CDGSH iron-sulfur domain-containing protein 1, putative / transcript_product=CDGSH iron-sulfur domain-containing protein 1, putative / location=Cvel_scaffold1251:11556-14462(+) / protein_length=225 / sequence_SO=supercontig / SO=protein_coding / is_pseudo=false
MGEGSEEEDPLKYRRRLDFNTREYPWLHTVVELLPTARKRIPFCRCWQSKKFPYCDGAHRELEKVGDPVGPFVLTLLPPKANTPLTKSNWGNVHAGNEGDAPLPLLSSPPSDARSRPPLLSPTQILRRRGRLGGGRLGSTVAGFAVAVAVGWLFAEAVLQLQGRGRDWCMGERVCGRGGISVSELRKEGVALHGNGEKRGRDAEHEGVSSNSDDAESTSYFVRQF